MNLVDDHGLESSGASGTIALNGAFSSMILRRKSTWSVAFSWEKVKYPALVCGRLAILWSSHSLKKLVFAVFGQVTIRMWSASGSSAQVAHWRMCGKVA